MENNKKPRIFIDKRGNWFQDGIKITHIWTYLSNNKNLDADDKGNFFIDEGTGRFYVEVEDTPFVVKMVYRNKDHFLIKLNDLTLEKLNFKTLFIGNENVLYVKVKNNKFDARFTRAAYYELMKNVAFENGNYFIENEGAKLTLKDESHKSI
ncbi:MAG: hypothetical protein ACRENO_02660 [Thermodesulfobacteriota bacterium]